jgi:hypothetical protein
LAVVEEIFTEDEAGEVRPVFSAAAAFPGSVAVVYTAVA